MVSCESFRSSISILLQKRSRNYITKDLTTSSYISGTCCLLFAFNLHEKMVYVETYNLNMIPERWKVFPAHVSWLSLVLCLRPISCSFHFLGKRKKKKWPTLVKNWNKKLQLEIHQIGSDLDVFVLFCNIEKHGGKGTQISSICVPFCLFVFF